MSRRFIPFGALCCLAALACAVGAPVFPAFGLPLLPEAHSGLRVAAAPALLLLLGALVSLLGAFALFLRPPRTTSILDSKLRLWGSIVGFLLAGGLLIAATQMSPGAHNVVLYPPSDSGTQVLKLLVGLAALAVLVARAAPRPRETTHSSRRARHASTILLGLAGFLGYWNWGAFHFPGFTHRHELFHYFIGAKHAPELRYTRLYDCLLQALQEQQPEILALESLRVQDLASNRLVFASSLKERMQDCPSHFSPERWQAFKRDAIALRAITGEATWNDSLIDFGFNAPPTWNVIPGAITRDLELSESSLFFVSLLDPALILIGFSFVAWAFGLEVACFAACFFGIFFPSRFFWTGGAFMRQDWLACLLVGASLLRKNFPIAAGFFLGCSGLLRVFPFAFLFFPLAHGIIEFVRTRRVDRGVAKLALGAAAAVAVLTPLGARSMGDFSAYQEFVSNSKKHLSSPFVNNIGLASLMSFRPRPHFSEDVIKADLIEQVAAYNEMRRSAFMSVRPIFFAAVIGFIFFALRCLKGERRLWVLSTFGFALVPVATNLACYYYSFLLVAAFLLKEQPRIVTLLFVVAVISQALALGTSAFELLYAAISLVVLYFVVESVLTFRLALQGNAEEDNQ